MSNIRIEILGHLSVNILGLKGLEIAKLIKRDISTLYPVLDELEKADLITSYYNSYPDPLRGGARARYYKITEGGVKAFYVHINAVSIGSSDLSVSLSY